MPAVPFAPSTHGFKIPNPLPPYPLQFPPFILVNPLNKLWGSFSISSAPLTRCRETTVSKADYNWPPVTQTGDTPVCCWSTRNLTVPLRDNMRAFAALHGISMEQAANLLITAGLYSMAPQLIKPQED